MTEYLAPILRTHFTNHFYRFGYTYIPKSLLLPIEKNLTDEGKKALVHKFTLLPPFEYDEEYVILKLEGDNEFIAENVLFNIENVSAIYPLSAQAKQSIENKIDPRIRLEEPIFETLLPEIENFLEKKEIEKAIDSLWQICKIEGKSEEVASQIGVGNLFDGLNFRKQGKKASQIKSANYWSILTAYDRYDYFPNTTIGYFYDAGQVFAFSKGLPTFEGSGLYNFLQSLNPESKFTEIVNFLESGEASKNYRNQAKTSGLRNYIVAPFFLRWKDELRNSDNDLFSTSIFTKNGEVAFINQYPNEVKAALTLLGAFFGFKKFYDSYYDSLNLRFFKAYKPTIQLTEQQTKAVEEEAPFVEQESNVSSIHEKYEKEEVNPILKEQNMASESESEIVKSTEPEIANDLQSLIIEILKEKDDISLTELSKELQKQTKRKFNNTAIENIVKGINEVEKYNDKRTKKIRLATSPKKITV